MSRRTCAADSVRGDGWKGTLDAEQLIRDIYNYNDRGGQRLAT
jgi:hypothetical protein